MSSQGSYTQRDAPSAAEPEIGRPVQFVTGPFTGRIVRARLTELQKADLGRKCGLSDRRSLDPPPVVRLRLYEVHNSHTRNHREEELAEVAEVENHGFVCHLNLFPMPSPFDHAYQSGNQMWQVPSSARWEDRRSPHGRCSSGRERPGPSLESVGNGSQLGHGPPGPVAAYMYGAPVLENSICTPLIAGTTFSASSLIQYQGVKQLMFVFPDISVKEGEFFLRYRVFNALYPVTGPAPLPILAECIGGPFRIYGTKDFPGLRASTDLTKVCLFPVHPSPVSVIRTRPQGSRRRLSSAVRLLQRAR
ncbi:hypothetical protein DAEQUDRAFT_603348 [Daedalea quercina L-15889]|uniref:Velvet domain-containing protein n=1 Tax=Daedalea quercina L-15889 TaxID=1314783 RepID=A0A165LM68_9APHY|nr:hypothetical protein DAEQUDRAFT_603348 [Daedalea quercina L-15889]